MARGARPDLIWVGDKYGGSRREIPIIDVNRHSPDCGSWREEDRPFGRLEQRQIACCVYGRPSKPPLDRATARKRVALPASGRTSGVVVDIWPVALMPARAVPAAGRSATECRRTSVAAPRLRPVGT